MNFVDVLKADRARVDELPEAAGRTRVRVSDFGDPQGELAAAAAGPVACPLLGWVAISVSGPDATGFLQGQLTNDVELLAVGAAQLNAWCSPKGRVLANFPLARAGEAEYLLIVPADIADALERRLRMFVLRSKVQVAALDTTLGAIGIYRPEAAFGRTQGVRREDGATIIDLADGRAIHMCAHEALAECWHNATRDARAVGEPVWDALAIAAGIAFITRATQDRFVPQMLNWELVGGVSFRKGCYPGQEIVARMQYLGRLKERLYRAHVPGIDVSPGASLYGSHFGEQACGTVVNVAPSRGGGTDLLAVLQVASAEADAIRLDATGAGPALELLPLPYAVAEPQASARG